MKKLQKRKIELKELYEKNDDSQLTGFASEDMPWVKHFTKEDLSSNIIDESIYDYIYSYGKNHMRDKALIYPNALGKKTWTYKKLFKEIQKVEKAFINHGVRKHDIVTICTSNTPETVFCFYAMQKIGVIVNMIHPLSSQGEINEILLRTNSKFLVTYEGTHENVNNIDKIHEAIKKTKVKKVIITNPCDEMPYIFKYIYTGKSKLNRKFVYENDKKYIEWKDFLNKQKKERNFGKYEINPDDTAALLCTGGSTGTPKLVELSHNNINGGTQTIKIDNNLLIPGKESTIIVMPLFHGFGLSNCLHLALASGVKSILMPKYNPKDFTKYTKKYKTTITLGVPKIFSNMIEHGNKLSMKNQKYMIYGGDKLSLSSYKKFNKYLKEHNAKEPLMGAFGLTECVAAVTRTKKSVINISPIIDKDLEVTNVGIPFAHNDVMIVESKTFNEIKGYNKLGVICIAGPSVSKGYYKDKEATKKTFFKYSNRNWLYTGDMGFIDKESGTLFFAQREKRLIISNGYNIYPAQIEKHINKIGVVTQSALVGIHHETKGQIPVLFVKVKYNTRITNEKQLKNEITKVSKTKFPRYAKINDVIIIDEFPMTKMNKTDIDELNNIYYEQKNKKSS